MRHPVCEVKEKILHDQDVTLPDVVTEVVTLIDHYDNCSNVVEKREILPNDEEPLANKVSKAFSAVG